MNLNQIKGSWNQFSAFLAARVKILGYSLATQQENAAAVLSRAFDRSQVFELILPSNGDPTTTAIRTLLSVFLARP